MGAQKNPVLEAALECARQGFRVFPLAWPKRGGGCSCQRGPKCAAAGKHPLQAGWQQSATTDPEKLAQIWRTWPYANIGLVTGESSGFIVIDIDPDKGGEESLEEWQRQHGRLPATVEVLTGSGGRHLYFRHPGVNIPNKQQWTHLPGLDIRGDGGLVVGPGSLHASGRRYEWEASSHPSELPMAACTPALLRLLTGPARNGAEGKRETRDEGSPAPVSPILEGCAWLRHCIHDAATLSEQEWYAMLTVAGRLEDGERLAHAWSKPHPQYTPEETAEKLRHACADTGPYTCATIRRQLGGEPHCSGCSHWGKITSPVVLGRQREAAWEPLPETVLITCGFVDDELPEDPDAVLVPSVEAPAGTRATPPAPALPKRALRQVPANVEAEMGVLGGAFQDVRAATVIAAELTAGDFYERAHGLIFEAVQDLLREGRSPNAASVRGWLHKRNLLERAGGDALLQAVAECAAGLPAVREYLRDIQEAAEHRWIIQQATEIAEEAYAQRKEAHSLRQDLVRKVLERERVRASGKGARDLREVWLDEGERIENNRREPVVYTGLDTVDRVAHGLQRGEIAIICGRPGMGKSVAGFQLARHAANTWGNTLIISLEMDAESMARRAMATETGIPYQQLRDSGRWSDLSGDIRPFDQESLNEIGEAIKRLRRTRHALLVDEDCHQLSRLIYRVHSYRIDPGIDCVVVDYGQLIKDDTLNQKSRVEEVTRVARALKNEVARPLNVPVYVLVQANREVDKRGAGKPNGKSSGLLVMSDLGWAAEWEQVAFQIHFLNRDPAFPKPEDGKPERVAPVLWDIHKNRNGSTGMVKLALEKDRFRFLSRDDKHAALEPPEDRSHWQDHELED